MTEIKEFSVLSSPEDPTRVLVTSLGHIWKLPLSLGKKPGHRSTSFLVLVEHSETDHHNHSGFLHSGQRSATDNLELPPTCPTLSIVPTSLH